MMEDLGHTCIFPGMLEAINLRTDQEYRQHICSAVKKLLALDFAKLSLFELWLCDAIWKSASIPAPAIETFSCSESTCSACSVPSSRWSTCVQTTVA